MGYLFEVGPTEGEHELSHQELAAWQSNSGVNLDDFESLALKQMSRAYLGMMHAARKPDCACPVQFDSEEVQEDETEDQRRARVNAEAEKVFGAMADMGRKKTMVKKGMGK